MMNLDQYDYYLGGINESFYVSEDDELCLRLSEVTQVQWVSKPLYYYRVHKASISQQQKAQQNRLALMAIKQARKRRQSADNSPVTLLSCAEFSTQPSQNLHIAPFVKGGWGDLKRLQSSKVTQESVSSIGKRFTQSLTKTLSHALAALPLLGAITVTPALAQIVPAADGTNTLVNTTGNQMDITGGQTSSNGANLFHSFSQFDVNTRQTANFQSNPTIQNILGRVVSGNASNINGLIQVSGSQANLYLMNPAGIIFGSNASLNVPASFAATTATSIGIGNNWFNAAGTNDYTQLNDTPNGFAFTTSQPGSIVNSGNLAVGAGKALMLLGGTVVNTGQLNAPSGQITMAAVPGTSLVRLSQPGSVLSLEVLPPASASNAPTQWTLPVLSLPQLLTGGDGGNATGLSVNAAGQAVLTGSGIQVPSEPGSAIASGSLNASGTASGQIGGTVQVLGNKVGLVSAAIDASGANGGGTVLIGGDYQGKGKVPNAARTFVSSDSVIHADALTQGNGGRVIVWADEATRFYGTVTARGGLLSGNGGFAEVSGKAFLDFAGIANLSADQGLFGTLLLDPTNITVVAGGNNPAELAANDQFADPGVNNTINNGTINAATANVILQATNDITFNAPINIAANGVGLTAQANNNISVNGTADLITNGGNISFFANGSININVDENAPTNISTNGGNITLRADFDNNGDGALGIGNNPNRTVINTNGGDFTGFGRGSNQPDVGSLFGIIISNTDINAGGGNIQLTGTGLPGGINRGIVFRGNPVVETTGTGTITLEGNAINGTNASNGILIEDAGGTIRAVDGTIRLIGNGNGTGTDNVGIDLGTNGVVETTGTGLIELIGTGGNGTNGNIGILVSGPSSRVSSVNGNVSLTGTGRGTGNGNHGIFMDAGAVVQSIGTGNITLTGTSNATGNNNDGISIFEGSVVETTGTGNITLNGVASGVADNQGIAIGGLAPGLTNARVSSVNGNINLIGTGAGNQIGLFDNHGILMFGSGVVESTETGAITLQGTGANGAAGIRLLENASINPTALSTATVTLTADEVDLNDNSQIRGIGILQLQTLEPNLGITVGGITNDARLNLDTSELNTLQNGFSQIFIGRNNASSAIALIGNVTFNDSVTLRSPLGNGSINTTGFTLSGADNATITLLANQGITTGNIINPGRQITITSNSSNIDTTAGTLDTSSATGNGGAIAFQANGNILTDNLNASSTAPSGNGGTITLDANDNIITGNLFSASSNSQGGEIRLSSGGIVSTGNLVSSSPNGSGGDINLQANGDITTGQIFSDAANNGGTIRLTSGGATTTTSLDSSGATGGSILINAATAITTGTIDSSGTTGRGGNVTLDPTGDIQVSSINAQGGTQGGDVDITTGRFFRATDTFTSTNGLTASISTLGGTAGGSITIRHDGGARDIPFNVGDTTINGTAGAITTGSTNSILSLQSFPGAYTQGNIQLITQNSPPSPPPPTLLPPSPSPSPQPDTAQVSKDIQGENLVPQGINTISASAFVLLNTTSITREGIDQAIASGQIAKAIALIEQLRMQEFQNHFEGNLTSDTGESGSVEQTQAVLSDIAKNTGKTPAVIYVFTQPDQLQLILVTPRDKPLLKTVYQANKDTLLKTATKFRSQITEPRNKSGYQATAKQLYQWLLEPLEAELQAKKIDTLVFSMDGGLRSIPMAALSDGKQFLVEKYSVGLIPSLNLTDTRYQDVKTTEVLAMGASKFSDQDPLPAVPVELSTIVGNQHLKAENRESLLAGQSSLLWEGLWSGEGFLNQGFTLSNLKAQRTQVPFGVIHLATHGQFNLGAPRNSYIQLWDTKLRLDQLRQMGWNNPSVELLVLSACRTALGNEDAEFGFGGLAVAAGVKSALASLWYVSDEGTLALMSKFYERLKRAPIKAEALREAQIAMIKGQVRIEGGKLRGIKQEDGAIPLPPELAKIGNKDLEHPYYWSAFTMIGSPC